MEIRLDLSIQPQPDDTTCGPTSLHAVLRYYGLETSLAETIADIPMLSGGGTLAVILGAHALKKGFQAKIYTYNLQVFDPTWFTHKNISLPDKLQEQLKHKPQDERLRLATEGYTEFLKLGGKVVQEPLSSALIRKYLNKHIPILAGLSATYLYNQAREYGYDCHSDDVRGFPTGHFVVLKGYDKEERKVEVADPYKSNPLSSTQYYSVGIDRLTTAILLGILTYDANLLIIEPKGK